MINNAVLKRQLSCPPGCESPFLHPHKKKETAMTPGVRGLRCCWDTGNELSHVAGQPWILGLQELRQVGGTVRKGPTSVL